MTGRPSDDSAGITNDPLTPPTSPRSPFATQVDPRIQERARATVRGVRIATGGAYSLAQLTEEALAAHCRNLEAVYNEGKAFPTHAGLRPGRRAQ